MINNDLEECIIQQDERKIIAILATNPSIVHQKTSLGISPLMLSCYYKLPKIVEIILQYHHEISLHEATSANKFDTVAHEIYKFPDNIDSYSEDGFTALSLACYFGNEEIARYLVLKGANVNLPSQNGFFTYPLHAAIAGNYINIANMLIDNNANVNCIQKNGITPLHVAAENGNIEILIKLLENNADVTIRMEGGKLPTDVAMEKGFIEIAEILAV